MIRMLASLGVLLTTGGCLSFTVEGGRDGVPHGVNQVHRLEPGVSTLKDVLQMLGPPDLLLRVGRISRLYYIAWDGVHYKFTVSAPVPLPARSVSTDAFILGLGAEDLRLARLEFDRDGILRVVQNGTFSNSTDGEYIAIDNRVVEGFIEDRGRMLVLADTDDDDDDDPENRPRK